MALDRYRAQETLYKVINSDIVSEELECELREIVNAIDLDCCAGIGFEGSSMEAEYARGEHCENCPRLKECADGQELVKED